jgi:hypothetical protein
LSSPVEQPSALAPVAPAAKGHLAHRGNYRWGCLTRRNHFAER